MHGAVPCHAYGGASRHENAADVGEVYVHGSATDNAAITGYSASEHAVAFGNWRLHRLGGWERARTPRRSACPCGIRFDARNMRLACSVDRTSSLQGMRTPLSIVYAFPSPNVGHNDLLGIRRSDVW